MPRRPRPRRAGGPARWAAAGRLPARRADRQPRCASPASSAPRAADRRGFDLAAYLRRRGIAGELRVHALRPTGRRRGGIGRRGRRRTRARPARDRARPAAAGRRRSRAAWCSARTSDRSSVTRDDFRASGLAHVLAVSGQNVMLLAALALPLLAAAGWRRRARIAVTVGADRALRAARRRRAVAAARRGDGRGVAGRAGRRRGRPRAGTRCCWRPASRSAFNPRACGRSRLAALVRRRRRDPRRWRPLLRAAARAAAARRWPRGSRSRWRPPWPPRRCWRTTSARVSLAGLPGQRARAAAGGADHVAGDGARRRSRQLRPRRPAAGATLAGLVAGSRCWRRSAVAGHRVRRHARGPGRGLPLRAPAAVAAAYAALAAPRSAAAAAPQPRRAGRGAGRRALAPARPAPRPAAVARRRRGRCALLSRLLPRPAGARPASRSRSSTSARATPR